MTGEAGMNELRKIADAATPGPWIQYGRNAVGIRTGGGNLALTYDENRQANSAHIATFDPPTVLAMLAVVEAAEARMQPGARPSAGAYEREDDALREALARFRQVHEGEHG